MPSSSTSPFAIGSPPCSALFPHIRHMDNLIARIDRAVTSSPDVNSEIADLRDAKRIAPARGMTG